MKRILLSFAIVGSVFFAAQGQDKPTVEVKDSASVSSKGQPKYTLQQCIQTALDNNLTVKRSVYNVESYYVNRLQAWGGFAPTIQANLSYAKNYGRSLNPVTYQYSSTSFSSLNPMISGQWTVFNGFRVQNNLRSVKKNVAASELDLEKAKNDVIINVASYYVTVILNRELFENAKIQLLSSQQQLDRIKKQVEAGALPKSNELNQEAIAATNEVTMINQENALNLSILQLKQVMQVPASTPLDVVIPDLAVEDMVIDQTPEEIYAISAQTLPQIKSSLLKVEAAQLALKAARGSYYPRLTVSASANTNYSSASKERYQPTITGYNLVPTPIGQINNTTTPGTTPADQLIYGYTPIYGAPLRLEDYGVHDQLTNNVYKQVAVGISIPILNGFNTRASVQQAVINEELAKITVKDNENTLRQSIETAYNNAFSAAKTYTASLKQVSASEEAYRMTKLRLDNGAANFVEFQISANDLFSARSSLARAKYNFLLTKKVLDFYQGKSIEY